MIETGSMADQTGMAPPEMTSEVKGLPADALSCPPGLLTDQPFLLSLL